MFQPAVIVLLCALLYIALRSRNRQIAQLRNDDLRYEMTEDGVRFKVESLTEDSFKLQWCSGWEFDRCYYLSGSPLRTFKKEGEEGLDFGNRVSIKVVPTLDWFASSKIGRANVNGRKVGQIYLIIPHQLARSLLDDLRRNPHQIAEVGIKRIVQENGKDSWGVFDFEVSEDFDVPQP